VPHRRIWSWYTGCWYTGCYISYSQEGTGQGCSPPRPLVAVSNVTVHQSMASVPITILLYNGPLLCGFNVPIKGKRWRDLYSAFTVVPHTEGAQAWITQFHRQITPCLPLPRKRSPDGASPDWGCRHLIAAYYSFIYPEKMKGWVGLVGWPTTDGLPT